MKSGGVCCCSIFFSLIFCLLFSELCCAVPKTIKFRRTHTQTHTHTLGERPTFSHPQKFIYSFFDGFDISTISNGHHYTLCVFGRASFSPDRTVCPVVVLLLPHIPFLASSFSLINHIYYLFPLRWHTRVESCFLFSFFAWLSFALQLTFLLRLFRCWFLFSARLIFLFWVSYGYTLWRRPMVTYSWYSLSFSHFSCFFLVLCVSFAPHLQFWFGEKARHEYVCIEYMCNPLSETDCVRLCVQIHSWIHKVSLSSACYEIWVVANVVHDYDRFAVLCRINERMNIWRLMELWI